MTRMRRIIGCWGLGVSAWLAAGCPQAVPDGDGGGDDTLGGLTTIEPDDFEEGQELTTASAHVTLSTTEADNVPISTFPVTANDDGFDFAPTGDKVFGHANVQFFNNARRLRMDFTAPVAHVEIQFAGGTFFETEIGRLQVFDAAGQLLDEDVSAPKEAGDSELLSITRGTADIAWALAYVAENEGSFGRFDALRFAAPAAEP